MAASNCSLFSIRATEEHTRTLQHGGHGKDNKGHIGSGPQKKAALEPQKNTEFEPQKNTEEHRMRNITKRQNRIDSQVRASDKKPNRRAAGPH